MKMADSRLRHAHAHMDRAHAEIAWREACWAYLRACLNGARPRVVSAHAEALWQARADLSAIEEAALSISRDEAA